MAEKKIYYCIGCGKPHPRRNFYTSYTHTNGVYPFCKEYIKKEVYRDNGTIDIEKFKDILRQADAPYIDSEFQGAIEEKRDAIGAYFIRINLPQNRRYTWKHSDFGDVESLEDNKEDTNINTDNICIKKNPSELTKKEIEILEDKWGFGYDPNEYALFEKKWNKLIDNYGRKTAMHVEGLKTYIRFRVKEELATAKGDVKEAKEWGQLASKAATDAKINVSQLSKSDISGGIDVLPQLFEAVESEVGIIPQLPKVLEQPYDDVDMIIWCNINYMRRLEDKPRVSYREIWNFYDEMLEEYCKQKGYNAKEIEEFKAKRRVPYRDMEQVYVEPVYEDGDL